MGSKSTSAGKRDRHDVTAAVWQRLDALTDEEITTAALKYPDNPPLTDERLAQLRCSALSMNVRLDLHMGRAAASAANGIRWGLSRDRECHQREPTAVELAYLRVIERGPEMANVRAPVPAKLMIEPRQTGRPLS
jgi:hypothetical protein